MNTFWNVHWQENTSTITSRNTFLNTLNLLIGMCESSLSLPTTKDDKNDDENNDDDDNNKKDKKEDIQMSETSPPSPLKETKEESKSESNDNK